ncbi:guanylate kinase [Desulfitobacterium chlororespirans]|uniref:Uncharacterized protein n=1 Tax=Desulfitobacterium chlororespirans DSM 11544 TaxID=1121395 RepID=A0A1M7TR09_9FIRM|nr:guanylate kinase [Desulfitobacterium chlororespirans]SHN73181.1 hypothetical protein SAMN02745215_02419 [Desulfitobacterium chlororespirans DSM 11544]
MSTEITNLATEVMVNLLLGVLTLLGALGSMYLQKGIKKLQAETAKVQEETTRKLFYDALARLDDVAGKSVNKIEQTTKKQLLKAVAEGSVGKEVFQSLAYEAYEEIIRTLEPDYLQVVQETMGDFQTYIMNLIEEKLAALKSTGQTSANLSAPAPDLNK